MFSDAQLQAASKELNGQAMPNFKSIGKDLAKEMNFEPPAETEEESEYSLPLPPCFGRKLGELTGFPFSSFFALV